MRSRDECGGHLPCPVPPHLPHFQLPTCSFACLPACCCADLEGAPATPQPVHCCDGGGRAARGGAPQPRLPLLLNTAACCRPTQGRPLNPTLPLCCSFSTASPSAAVTAIAAATPAATPAAGAQPRLPSQASKGHLAGHDGFQVLVNILALHTAGAGPGTRPCPCACPAWQGFAAVCV